MQGINVHVALGGVFPVDQRLWRHPFYRQLSFRHFLIIIRLMQISRQSKVRYLHFIVVTNQHVSGSQVSVQTLKDTHRYKDCREQTTKYWALNINRYFLTITRRNQVFSLRVYTATEGDGLNSCQAL